MMLCVRRQIHTLHLIRQNNTRNLQALGKLHFKWIPFDLTGDRAEESEADAAIIGRRRQHDSLAMPCLFMAGLRAEP